MTETTGTQKLAGGALPAPEAANRVGNVDSALERLWHFLTSMKFALLLILAFAGLTLIGTLVIQMPAGVADDPQARADWIASVRPRYGGWTGPLDTLGFFNMFSSFWVKLTGALLAASTIACTVQRIPGTWRTMRNPTVNVGPAFFEHAPQHEAMTFHKAPAAVLETTQAVFRKRRFRTLVADDGSVHLYADRNRWAPWAGLVAHISIVVILAGAMVGSMFGFRDSQFMLTEGSTSTVPTKDDLSITLASFTDTYDPATGAPIDYVSDVTLTRGGQTVAHQLVRVNEPLRYEDVSFYQAFFGPAALLTVKDSAGATVYQGGVPLAWTANNGGNKVGTFTVPGQNLTAWVVATTGPDDPTIKPGQVAIELYKADTGDAVVQKSIDQGKPTEINGLTYTFDREAKYTGLNVAKDPGTPIVWLGCFLLVAGFVVRLFVPFRRLWGRLEARPDGGSSLSIAAVGRHDSGFDAEFTSIVTDIRQAMTGQAKS
jgi:cytochrome c biogenesis protein